MPEICFLDSKTLGDDTDLSLIERMGTLVKYGTTGPEEVAGRIAGCEIVITNKVVLKEENLRNAPQVKLICVAATGTNNIDIEYARSKGIAVANVAGYSTPSVAQHTFAMLFYLLERLSYYDGFVKSGDYARSSIFTNQERPFHELQGKNWGIIGMGAIGRTVASIAEAFGCNVSYYSTSGRNNVEQYRRMELEGLLESSDVVSIHAPLNANTTGLISYNRLKLMKKDAVLVNAGRGGIVDEAGLAKALDEGLIYGAALDVLESEPIQEGNPLLKLEHPDRLIITPHIAWASIEAKQRLVKEIALNIEAYLKGEKRSRVC